MFNSKKEAAQSNQTSRESSSNGGGINSLATATKIIGDLTADHDIRIDGLLKGHLKCGGKVILGPKGKVIGEIECENAVIEGSVEGFLIVKDTLQIKETGNIIADIKCKKIVVHHGAKINGKCETGGQTIAPKTLTQVKSA
ncbi:MAG: cytoskeletal protein CcmA (bactofilin family) [Saprospiraceae bacterium]|jgi:cytoskeletal protein CcmA (bactofilin family)